MSITGDEKCVDCEFEIKPPYGRIFYADDGKGRCGSCHIEFFCGSRTTPLPGKFVYETSGGFIGIPKFDNGGALKNSDSDQLEMAVSMSPPRVLVRQSELKALGADGVRERYRSPNAEIVAVADDVFDSSSPCEKMRFLQS
jgi:hypothetical protein